MHGRDVGVAHFFFVVGLPRRLLVLDINSPSSFSPFPSFPSSLSGSDGAGADPTSSPSARSSRSSLLPCSCGCRREGILSAAATSEEDDKTEASRASTRALSALSRWY